MKVCISAGHQNIKYNSLVKLHGSTGAPGEVDFNIDVANQVSAQLRERGFEVKQTDANANDDPKVTGVDWDLFLAIHYDADIYNKPGGFVDYPEPSTDFATEESQRIAKILASEYFKTTGIEYHPERSNPNTRHWYMWQYLSKATPCNIIECGVGWRVPEDHNLFTYHREKVVEGIVRGVCKAFSVPYQTEPVLTVEEQIKQAVDKALIESELKWQKDMETAKKQIEELKKLSVEDYTWKQLLSLAWKKYWVWKKGGGVA